MEEKYVECKEEFIVLAIPADTLMVDITAKIDIDGEIVQVTKHMSPSEVRDAIYEAKQGYMPSDTVFALTPLGEEYLEDLKKRYSGDEEEDY